MVQESNDGKKIEGGKKTVLPFIVHRAPLQNHLAYEKKGHWSQKEKLKYVIFLQFFKEKFTSRDKKKRFCRIFKVMSDFIKTRTHNQCRSHHQKMEKQRFQVDSIIKNVVSKYHPRVYKELSERYLIEIENLSWEDHDDNKLQNINQNLVKQSSDSNLHQFKNNDRLKAKLKPKFKSQSPDAEYLNCAIKAKPDQEIAVIGDQPIFIKRELRMTQECQEEDEELHMAVQEINYSIPPRRQFFAQKPQSLDFGSFNNFMGLRNQKEKDGSLNFVEYLNALEIRKAQSFNKASYHYNQMQIQLGNVAQCETEKSHILEIRNQRIAHEPAFNYGYSNLYWNYQDLHKPF